MLLSLGILQNRSTENRRADQLRPYIAPFPASEHFGARGQLIRRIDMVSEPYPLGYTPTMVFTQPPVEDGRHAAIA